MVHRVLFIAFLGLVLAADAADESAKKDLALMQGTWTCVEAEVDGRALEPAEKKKAKITVKGDKLSIAGVLDAPATTGLSLNAGKEPREIDLHPAQQAKGKIGLGIYAVEENGLKLCLNVFTTDNDRGKQRPTDFSAKAGSNRLVLVLKKK